MHPFLLFSSSGASTNTIDTSGPFFLDFVRKGVPAEFPQAERVLVRAPLTANPCGIGSDQLRVSPGHDCHDCHVRDTERMSVRRSFRRTGKIAPFFSAVRPGSWYLQASKHHRIPSQCVESPVHSLCLAGWQGFAEACLGAKSFPPEVCAPFTE